MNTADRDTADRDTVGRANINRDTADRNTAYIDIDDRDTAYIDIDDNDRDTDTYTININDSDTDDRDTADRYTADRDTADRDTINRDDNNTADRDKYRLKKCILANIALLTLITIVIMLFGDKSSPYLQTGPSPTLQILGIQIDNWFKYWCFQVFVAVVVITDVIIKEIADPVLGFRIYNPTEKTIYGFTRLELQLFANSMWMISSLKSVLMVVVTISQIDIAILKVIYGEITSFYTIRLLVNEKNFPLEDDIELQIESQKYVVVASEER